MEEVAEVAQSSHCPGSCKTLPSAPWHSLVPTVLYVPSFPLQTHAALPGLLLTMQLAELPCGAST